MQIFIVDALAGAAKTYNAIRVATADVRAGEKYIFGVPSTRLADQITADCRGIGCAPVNLFHTHDGSPDSVVARLTGHFQTTLHNHGEVVVMTMAALERLSYIEKRASWHLIVDELPSPVYHQRFILHENRAHLLDLFDVQPYNAAYSMLCVRKTDIGRVMDLARNRWTDEITAQVAEFANKLLSEHWRCFVLNDQLARFEQPKDHVNALDVFGLLQPTVFDGFKSVTMMGACLTESMIYCYWLSLGVAFAPHPKIIPRFTAYPNADLVTIQYAIDRDWSARLRDTLIDGKRVIEIIAERCQTALNGEPFVYLINASEDNLTPESGVRLPHVAHGINQYGNYHNAMLLSALNPPPAYFQFCNDMLGISSDELRTAIYRTSTYQAAMRINRDPNDPNRKRLQVVDKATATWLGKVIGTNRLEKLPGNDIVPSDRRRTEQPKTNAELLVSSRQRIRQNLVAGLDLINQFKDFHAENPRQDILKVQGHPVSENCPEIPRENMHIGNIFTDTQSRYGTSTRGISVHSFRTLLAELHLRVIDAKDDNQLISACSFNPNLADTWRGNANIVSMSGIWLDNDGGDLTPADFAKMLKVPVVIYNSFSSTPSLLKWRVWIPTSHLITPAVHRELVAQIKKMLIDRKFYGASYIRKNPDKKVKRHGLDEGKLTQAVLFYLPCQAKAGAEASFFDEYHWQNALLNPYEWIDRSIVDHRPPTISQVPQPPSDAPQTLDEVKIGAANAKWQSHSGGDGNAAFYKLAVAYRHAGLSWYDAEPLLHQQAQFAHSRGSVAHRLIDLKGYGRKVWRS
jgi:hypothetical protein